MSDFFYMPSVLLRPSSAYLVGALEIVNCLQWTSHFTEHTQTVLRKMCRGYLQALYPEESVFLMLALGRRSERSTASLPNSFRQRLCGVSCTAGLFSQMSRKRAFTPKCFCRSRWLPQNGSVLVFDAKCKECLLVLIYIFIIVSVLTLTQKKRISVITQLMGVEIV